MQQGKKDLEAEAFKNSDLFLRVNTSRKNQMLLLGQKLKKLVRHWKSYC